ncbi:MAG: DUF1538 domain-containing protein [Mariprofundaceae bacterium]|nr:DUF1538 domain-containing protein [Mariprofundaceae bacterium]
MLKGLRYILQPVGEAVRDLTPIVLVIVFFQSVVLRQPIPNLERIIIGIVLVLVGLALFVRGLKIGLFPVGESMAQSFVRKGSAAWLLLFAFALGFATTVAEPALIVIAAKAAEVAAADGMIQGTRSAMESYALGLRLTVALSVGCAIVLGVLRIIFSWPLHWCIMAGYLCVVGMTYVAPHEIIGIAYDSGGVTTSTITVPMVTALGVGLAGSLRGRNPVLDGFGLIAFASLLPVLFVMFYGIWAVGG